MHSTRALGLLTLTLALTSGCKKPTPAQFRPTVEAAPAAARTGLIREGELAPTFAVTAHNGARIESHGPRARPLVLYFYPRDETPGCTIEAHGFRDSAADFAAAGADVAGVSTDNTSSHSAFAAGHQLGFALVSDPDATLAAAFGVRVRMGFAQRVTFVIDRSGHVRRVFESVTPEGHATEVLAAVRAL
ncbi:MAG: peroxiredoxin [Deltaproteobacteria bacterium]|nr:peroxiredoxin [Deltaproteobacteria bacterium]